MHAISDGLLSFPITAFDQKGGFDAESYRQRLNFVPDLTVKFYMKLRQGNTESIKQITNDFFIPIVDLGYRKPGYDVSLIKAGAISSVARRGASVCS